MSATPERDELDKILICNCTMDGIFGKHYADCPQALKVLIASHIEAEVLRGRIDELKDWRTMVQRLSEYVDSKDSLIEFDDRIDDLEHKLKTKGGGDE